MAARAWVSGKTCSRCPLSTKGKMPNGGCSKGSQESDWNIKGVESTYCPVMDFVKYNFIFKSFNSYRNNIMPYKGGKLEQPALLMNAIEIVEEVFFELKQEEE